MKMINEFEKKLIEKVSQLENQDVNINDFEKYLHSDGYIQYSYTSILLGCEITATYKGFRCYGNKMRLVLNIDYHE
ncbi:MAG: hypothetical protein LBK94_09810 [Prevotellaceae bacterium]|jgi:hypothetical protein|nr:hypothetical protein [Prevotellaceae bacterium]